MTDKQQIIYEQNCQDFRQLNNVMWQVPVLAMTLTGGIWFGISTVQNAPWIQVALWLLSTVANIVFIFVLRRLREGIMERILEEKRKSEGVEAIKGRYTVVIAFSLVLVLAAVISGIGSVVSIPGVLATETDKIISINRLIVEKNDDGLNVYCE